jgi:hypothetical protein
MRPAKRSFVARVARAAMRYPRVCYAVRGVQMRVRPPRHTEPPLRDDVARYERLFASSEKSFDEMVRPWRGEFAWPAGRTNNGTFESVDVELYHAILRTHRPKLVIEVGGGHSSGFSTEALAKNGDGGRVVLVDPRPRVRVPRSVEHVRSRIEDVDVSFADTLHAGDVLFIDSSHTTEEASYHVSEILPRLRSGVVIHHHDVLFPYDAYYLGDRETFGEPDVLLEFYERNTDRFEVIVGAAWVVWRNRALVSELVDSYRWQPGRIPGSLWTRVRP